ncbi:hypothetical protein E7T06_05300 [Deinococcus sp. Arct2-2]|uniref:hypothetical protein n=1 Tax=Deinococcus sp. Arct2-2 TaxID=2568653 RepID=UPI0010A3E7FD|nr:hypothetical protein [Deinococcus sp. Arct2-2]THF70972.1 hypothetical protein E7T06_05300 [Deinococcus sp. Arct2-2]
MTPTNAEAAGNSNTTFFTVVGSQDPQPTPGGTQGPGLDLLEALLAAGERPTEVLVVWTPGEPNRSWEGGYDAQQAAFVAAVKERLPQAKVTPVPLRVRPNAAAEVLPVLAQALERFRHGGRLHVNTSSGTPQMLEALKVLRGTGWFAGGQVTLWQIDRPEHRQTGQPFHREATTPFLEETLRLDAAFSALRRFDFAGAEDAFRTLAAGSLELPARQQAVAALADVAQALWWLDARDFGEAQGVLADLTLHVPPLVPLRTLLASGAAHDADALIWLTWSRYDRAASQNRVADALIWAVTLHELLVIKLAEHHGLPDSEKSLRPRDLAAGLFERLAQEVPDLLASSGKELKFMGLKEKLQLLRAPALGVPDVDVFDAGDPRRAAPHPALAQVRSWRNRVVHQGSTPKDMNLDVLDKVVRDLLAAFPFQAAWAKAWVADPDAAPVSAAAISRLTGELQAWVG